MPNNHALQAQSLAENLVNQFTPDGWLIEEKLPKPGTIGAEDQTGSYFSVGYIASKGGQRAFLKAIDIENAIRKQNPQVSLISRLKNVTESHSFECEILEACRNAKLDKIVRVISQGEIEATTPNGISVPYILFELADGDVRKVVSKSSKIDDAWRFRVLHHVAVGIQQLHGQKITHQDLKPSNVLIFDQQQEGAKIADLGRASRIGQPAAHDAATIPGAIQYAPPEQVYGDSPPRWQDREGCDLYHLGTLACFLFIGITPTTYYGNNMERDVLPRHWGGEGRCDYTNALPILTSHFSKFLHIIRPELPAWAADDLTSIIMSACHPNFATRGDPGTRSSAAASIGIDRYVSKFDLLAKRAEIELRR